MSGNEVKSEKWEVTKEVRLLGYDTTWLGPDLPIRRNQGEPDRLGQRPRLPSHFPTSNIKRGGRRRRPFETGSAPLDPLRVSGLCFQDI
ncbi:MAG: hypothetical protein B6245_07305 [Desulfobacteraceae bacterium 4572_88]|nr:MAG: hypothetical protein B6245_07305 [Desulfobacteraceae bacterium 4572_88]